MQSTVEPVARLIEELARLPGIGPKTAQRLTFHLLRVPTETARALADAIVHMKEAVIFCSSCMNITDDDPCSICRSETRDRSVICVVEEPLDVLALERTREFKGQYHVLHGAINPIENVGIDDLKVRELLRRLDGDVQEVILATNPNVEGETTSMYIAKLIQPLGVKVSRLARGRMSFTHTAWNPVAARRSCDPVLALSIRVGAPTDRRRGRRLLLREGARPGRRVAVALPFSTLRA